MQALFGFGRNFFYIWPEQAWQQWVRRFFKQISYCWRKFAEQFNLKGLQVVSLGSYAILQLPQPVFFHSENLTQPSAQFAHFCNFGGNDIYRYHSYRNP